MNSPKILVVEDDKAVRNLIAITLQTRNYKYILSDSGESALLEFASEHPDVILLDLGLPDIDGMEVIQKIREKSQIPIIILSARGEESDKVAALDAGADDYLTKPFSVEELLARLRVALRRTEYIWNSDAKNNHVFENGDLKIDYASSCVTLKGEEIHLTPIEYKILNLLSKNIGKILTHTYLTREIWGSAFDSDVASLRVFMANLRKKIEPEKSGVSYIQTHVGIGYRMVKIEKSD